MKTTALIGLVAVLSSLLNGFRPPVPRAEVRVVVPFEELLKRPVKLRPELNGKHPRVFFSDESLKALRHRAKTGDRDLWKEAVKNIRALSIEPPPPGSPMLNRSGVEQIEGDLSQYDVAYILAEVTFAYAIEQDSRYLEAARKWLLTVIKYEPWGYTFRSPNVDLPPAHLLYAVGFAYDVLFDQLKVDERVSVQKKLALQARLMFDYFKYKPRKRYSYSQNHTFIPMAGLAVAALALMGEDPAAEEWARLARAIFDRTLETFGTDGYYYEGFHYNVFAIHWIIRYLDALEHATGEDLYPRIRDRFQPLKFYVAHSVLPDGRNVFDFGDTGQGATDRNNQQTLKLNTAYEVIYRLATKYRDAEAQGIGQWLHRELKTTTWEKTWAFYAHDPDLPAVSLSSMPTFHYFPNSETAFWRSSWQRDATAFAFRCGPPEGHHAAKLLPLIPDWRQSTGHAHPDANSFIIYSRGQYLTGDTGYTGVKLTEDHNTILVDGRGQENDGRHEVFKEVPYERLNKLRLADYWATSEFFYARGEAAPAYFADLNVSRFDRHFLYVSPDYFVIWDELATNEPREFSWLLNADEKFRAQNENSFAVSIKDAALFVHRLLPASVNQRVASQMVTTQGRPGEVEKGKLEQRGFQLVESTNVRSREIQFLHFLSAAETASKRNPRLLALAGVAGGLRIEWPNGDEETVLLRDQSGDVRIRGERAVVRVSRLGMLQRLVLQRGTQIERNGVELFHSLRSVSASFAKSETQEWRGTVITDTSTTIVLSSPVAWSNLRINGLKTRSEYDELKKTISFNVPAGTNVIEAN
ncbi:MAG TPA: DUF4962 domain-containing protein [Pyrinomonadaceae bacterium]|nr:DUF4962 domain-containing protein [Pyrinomonadaceae bacterium]